MARRKTAFTLAESLIVIGCVCLLALLAVPQLSTLGSQMTTRAVLDRFKAMYEKYENRARLTGQKYRIVRKENADGSTSLCASEDCLTLPKTMTASVNGGIPWITEKNIVPCTWTFVDKAAKEEYSVTVQLGWGRLFEKKEKWVPPR